jgi:hypothetical protein
VLALPLLLAVGCESVVPSEPPAASSAPVFFPTYAQNPAAPVLMARAIGRLVIHDGCVFLRRAQGPDYLVAWPRSSRLDAVNGRPAVIDSSGRSAFIGDEVTLVGGELDGSGGDPSVRLESMIGQVVPRTCRTGSYWTGALGAAARR